MKWKSYLEKTCKVKIRYYRIILEKEIKSLTENCIKSKEIHVIFHMGQHAT